MLLLEPWAKRAASVGFVFLMYAWWALKTASRLGTWADDNDWLLAAAAAGGFCWSRASRMHAAALSASVRSEGSGVDTREEDGLLAAAAAAVAGSGVATVGKDTVGTVATVGESGGSCSS